MKIESLMLEKFGKQQLSDDMLKNVIGGEPKCTGGGFNKYGSQPDATGIQMIYESWDSDMSENGKIVASYGYNERVLGDCYDDEGLE